MRRLVPSSHPGNRHQFQVAPVANVGAQLSGGSGCTKTPGMVPCRSQDPRLRPDHTELCGEAHLVIEVIGRSCDVELAVLDVAPEIRAHLEIVVSVADRNHVRVGINFSLNSGGSRCRSRTRLHRAGEMNLGNAAKVGL